MPSRSPKMKRRIFGFQRRVWWPKWTPASSSSLIPTWATEYSLAFGGAVPAADSWTRLSGAGQGHASVIHGVVDWSEKDTEAVEFEPLTLAADDVADGE